MVESETFTRQTGSEFLPCATHCAESGENGAPEVAALQVAVLGWPWVLRDTRQPGGWSWGREAELEP